MATIGVLGVTIPGALDCISKINQLKGHQFPKGHHPNIIYYQPDFQPMEELLRKELWSEVLDSLEHSMRKLTDMKVDFVIIPANTVHKVVRDLQKRTATVILNMLELVAAECKKRNYRKVGVMGTTWTMSGHVFQEELAAQGIEEVIPQKGDQDRIQLALFSELIPHGTAKAETVARLERICDSLKEQGCEAVILGCTELPLVLNDRNCSLPVLDNTTILVEAALKRAAQTAKISKA